ncbi:MAG: non-ribosomal peptide synthetase [Anaerolineae bacterium]|nr:non-ribosomal peptide synthetase [Anaerolineae bacterium]
MSTSNLEERIANLSPEKRALLNQRLQEYLAREKKAFAIAKRDLTQPNVLSYSQQRLWFLQQLEPDSNAYNETSIWRLEGKLDVQVFERSLREIMKRHEVTRTKYRLVNDEPVQVVASTDEFSLQVFDLRHIPEAERETHLHRQAQADSQRPFNLVDEIPIRYKLYQLADTTYIFLNVHHHICSDGWSSGVFYRELGALYNAFISGKASPLMPISIQYADYAVWQRQQLQGAKLNDLLQYWQQKLAGVPESLNLPFDFARPESQSAESGVKRFVVPANLVGGLKQLARQSDATLYMVLLAAFKVLLMRYTNQTDIVIGSPIANRQHPEIESLLGMFVNTLVMRSDLSGNPSFRDLLRQVRQTALDAYDHQDLPFEKLVEVLQPTRRLNYNPIVQSMLSVQNTPKSSFELQGLSVERLRSGEEKSKFDLSLAFNENVNGLTGQLIYNITLFAEDTIDRLTDHLLILFAGIIDNPECGIEKLPIISEAEHTQFLKWNATTKNYPKDRCIHELFEAQVLRTPENIAVVCDSDKHLSPSTFATKSLTYRQLNERANHLAHHLKTIGVANEGLVGIFLDRSCEMIISIMGVLKSGAAYVPFEPTYPRDRIESILKDGGIQFMITSRDLSAMLPPDIATVVVMDTDVEQEYSAEPPVTLFQPRQLAYVLFTSGSTGQPKGVMVEHQQIVNYVYAMLGWCVPPGSSCAMVQPLTVDSCLTMLFPPLLSGGVLHVISRDLAVDAHGLADYLQQNNIDCLKIAPSHLAALQSGDSTVRLLPLQSLIIGGEASHFAWVEQLQQLRPGCKIFNHYGPTETTVGVLTYPVFSAKPKSAGLTTPIGYPIANTQTYILDKHLRRVPVNVSGELYIGGDNVARGYLKHLDLTNEKFLPNPFAEGVMYKTGDLARYLVDGAIEFLGRDDFQVKIRGFRIELSEIENVLLQHHFVQQCVVVAHEKSIENKQLVAYVVLHPDKVITIDELRNLLQQKLPAYMLPAAIVILPALPHSEHGKVDRKALMERPIEKQISLSQTTVLTPIQSEIAHIWRELLRLDHVDMTDNFFDLGGHSLLTVRLLLQIEQRFGVRLSLRQFIIDPTITFLDSEITKAKLQVKHVGDDEKIQVTDDEVNVFEGDEAFNHWYDTLGKLTQQRSKKSLSWRKRIIAKIPKPIIFKAIRWLSNQPRIQQRYREGDLVDLMMRYHQASELNLSVNMVIHNAIYYHWLWDYIDVLVPMKSPKMVTKNTFWARVEGFDLLIKAKETGQGVILANAHILPAYISNLTALINFKIMGYGVMSKTSNTSNTIEKERAFWAHQLEIAWKVLQQGGVVSIGADVVEGAGPTHDSEFLGRQRYFRTSFAELALMTNAQVILVTGEAIPDQPMKITLSELDKGDPQLSHQDRVKYLMCQYIENLKKMWQTMPWMVDKNCIRDYLDYWPIVQPELRNLFFLSFRRFDFSINHFSDLKATKNVFNFIYARQIFDSLPAHKKIKHYKTQYFFSWLADGSDYFPKLGSSTPYLLLSNLALYIYMQRSDIILQFPDIMNQDRLAFIFWFLRHATEEYKIPSELTMAMNQSLMNWSAEHKQAYASLPVKMNLPCYIWQIRKDLQLAFPNFDTTTQPHEVVPFLLWFFDQGLKEYSFITQTDNMWKIFKQWANEADITMPTLTRIAAGLWQSRADLQEAFKKPENEDHQPYIEWLLSQSHFSSGLRFEAAKS